MYVKDHMTANPITITPDTSVGSGSDAEGGIPPSSCC